jgi:hypothetical protein
VASITVTGVRWDSLFDDLEAQAHAQQQAVHEAEVADLIRAELAAVTLVDRLRAHRGERLGLRLVDGGVLQVEVEDVGADCLLGRGIEPADRALIPLAAVVAVAGLGRSVDPGSTASERRLGLAAALRRLARDRATVRLHLRDSAVLTGTVDRVGADHLDLSVHPQEVERRPRSVTAVQVVPFAAVVRIGLPS